MRVGAFHMDEIEKLRKATYHLWTFTISKLISTFGSQVYAFAISFYILQSTGSATSFALNLICNLLPRTLISPFAGVAADKYSRKKIVIGAQIATTIAIGGLLVFSIVSGLSLVAIYTTTVVLSLTSTFSGVTFTSSISGLVDQDRLQKAMSLNQVSISFAAIASPAVGGILYGAVSMTVFLIVYMVASIIAILCESTMNFNLFANRKEKSESENSETVWQSMKAGISYLKLQPIIMIMIWISLLINFLFGAFEVGYSYVLIEKFKVASNHFGFTQGAFAIGMLVFSIYFSMRKEVRFPFLLSKWGVIGMGFIIGAVSLPLFSIFPYVGLVSYYIGIMFALGSLVIVVNTPLHVLLQKQIDDDFKGRIFSLLETMAMALMPLGMVLYGLLYDMFPAQWVLIGSSVMLIVIVLILARPAVVRKAHPELANHQKGQSATRTVS